MIGSVTTLGLSGVSIGDLYAWSGGGVIVTTGWHAPMFQFFASSQTFQIGNNTQSFEINNITQTFEVGL